MYVEQKYRNTNRNKLPIKTEVYGTMLWYDMVTAAIDFRGNGYQIQNYNNKHN